MLSHDQISDLANTIHGIEMKAADALTGTKWEHVYIEIGDQHVVRDEKEEILAWCGGHPGRGQHIAPYLAAVRPEDVLRRCRADLRLVAMHRAARIIGKSGGNAAAAVVMNDVIEVVSLGYGMGVYLGGQEMLT